MDKVGVEGRHDPETVEGGVVILPSVEGLEHGNRQGEAQVDLSLPQPVHILHGPTGNLCRVLSNGVPEGEATGDGAPYGVVDSPGPRRTDTQELSSTTTSPAAPTHNGQNKECETSEKDSVFHESIKEPVRVIG